MAIPSTYFTSTKNLPKILEQIQKGKVPSKFSYDHLKQLGFPSSHDRPIIPVLKALGFLDAAGVPQERYRRYKDPSNAKRVLAEGIREAYTDIFAIDESANKLPADQAKGIIARLSDKGDAVVDKMALTFRALVEQADFSVALDIPGDETPEAVEKDAEHETKLHAKALTLRHDVHVHLPISDDIKVYDAIFRSLRDNLLV
jgi:Family of unknown function (DUF5343)